MASIGNLVDAIRAAIPTYSGFTSKQEIPNPYSLEDNSETFLEDSWGLLIGSGTRAEADTLAIKYQSVGTVRSIGVILSRVVYDIDGQCGNVTTEVKSLLADAKTIRDNFLSLTKFGVLKGGEDITYDGDSGVEFTIADKARVIHTQIDFTFEIVENIN